MIEEHKIWQESFRKSVKIQKIRMYRNLIHDIRHPKKSLGRVIANDSDKDGMTRNAGASISNDDYTALLQLYLRSCILLSEKGFKR